jgi:hypothetical protein
MAYSFPLTLAQFRDKLRVTSMILHCPAVVEESVTGAGEVLRASLGASLWQGDIALAPALHADLREAQALLDVLLRPGASFMLQPPNYSKDSAGTGATLDAVASNNRDVTLTGIAPGYQVEAGDYVSWAYGNNPERFAFHQVVQGGAANASGDVTVEVNPIVRPGWTSGAMVRLIAPRFKAVLRSRNPGQMVPLITSGVGFSFIQTLR